MKLSRREQATINSALTILEKHARKGEQFLNTEMAIDYFRLMIGGEGREHFAVAYLDNSLRLIESRIESIGSLNYVDVDPKEILRSALTLEATHVILAHNHPSGKAMPSQHDIDLTKTIKETLGLCDVMVCEHVIVTNEDAYSFSKDGNL